MEHLPLILHGKIKWNDSIWKNEKIKKIKLQRFYKYFLPTKQRFKPKSHSHLIGKMHISGKKRPSSHIETISMVYQQQLFGLRNKDMKRTHCVLY